MEAFSIRNLRERRANRCERPKRGICQSSAKHGRALFVVVPMDELLLNEGSLSPRRSAPSPRRPSASARPPASPGSPSRSSFARLGMVAEVIIPEAVHADAGSISRCPAPSGQTLTFETQSQALNRRHHRQRCATSRPCDRTRKLPFKCFQQRRPNAKTSPARREWENFQRGLNQQLGPDRHVPKRRG